VQREIDRRFAAGTLPEPASPDFIPWVHAAFYRDAAPDMLVVARRERQVTMIPGTFRSLPEHAVEVGRHLPPSANRVADFMDYFARRYRVETLGPGMRIAAMAAAHHGLNYIHPFLDGNGRVSRLISHAMALRAGVGAHSLWSVSRGLARGLESRDDYKRMMDHADMPR